MSSPSSADCPLSSPSPFQVAAPRPRALHPHAHAHMPTVLPASLSRRGSGGSSSDDADQDELLYDAGPGGAHESEVAVRRASHNAVERARRDKLNARILQLSTLLPNLAGVRRPSRLAITKSSIAQIHLARRHRVLAAHELRALHAENGALRGELNRWRARAGVPPLAETDRGDAFALVAAGAEAPDAREPVETLDEDDFDERFGGTGFDYEARRPRSHAYHPYPQPQPQAQVQAQAQPPSRFAYGPGTPSISPPVYPSPPSSSEYLPSAFKSEYEHVDVGDWAAADGW
ncbi:Macrophage erythroblast attacher isoform 1 [Mycena indigotica]|uniref:Macrophage erythroblast attacher isoform 1 n=1 Tax=Mycena indigotica TaxID=2126181 RepID=A0A8H6S4V9_9AGAR|nr:Macrophage erythroblast attacher isoform 1 [Mycena indigotica]KAF7291355.1 Macrophage erythroblast attacher isoform 1 [Mycena indigotica]